MRCDIRAGSVVRGILLAVGLVSSAGLCTEVNVYLNNEDHVTAKELTLKEASLSVTTSSCGRMVIERAAVKGISWQTERAEDILEFTGATDVVHNRNGDRLSGRIVEIKDGVISIEAYFTQGRVVTVKLEELDFLTFASEKTAEAPTGANVTRVIFLNGDVVSGKIKGFEAGEFILDPPYGEAVRVGATAFRSLHNAKESKEFYAGGVAEAFMDIIERSGEAAGIYYQVYPSLVKSFLKEGDAKAALHVFRRITDYQSNPYIFQRIGDEFFAVDMLEPAVEAYEKMIEASPTYYGAYGKLFNAYLKMGKNTEAAATYEQLLSTPTVNLSGYGLDAAQVRMELSDVYVKLKEYDKAAEQLRQVVVTPPETKDFREAALSKLIGIFREQGKVETLVERYRAELAEKNKVLGESYLGLVQAYLGEGHIMKAKTYVDRLDQLGLTEDAAKARQLLEEQETR